MNTKWIENWSNTDHDNLKYNSFKILDNFLNFAPATILDIGCGLAKESELFQKKYKSFLYLLDGDFDSTIENNREIRYGNVNDFKFYSKIKDLKMSFDNRKIDYKFIDANKLEPLDCKVDLVYSILSCGFHYPAKTYKEYIKKHTYSDSVIIMDIRRKTLEQQKQDFEIVNVVKEYKKHLTLQIKFS